MFNESLGKHNRTVMNNIEHLTYIDFFLMMPFSDPSCAKDRNVLSQDVLICSDLQERDK